MPEQDQQGQDTKTNPILKTSRIAAGILFLLLVLGVLFYTKKDFFSPQKVEVPQDLTLQPPAQLAREVRALTNKSSLVFPEVISYEEVSLQGLPQFVQQLTKETKGVLTVSRDVSYANGLSGYRVHFDVPLPLLQSHQAVGSFFQQSGWSILASRHTALSALVEVENNQYQARIIQTKQGESQTLVVIQLISK